MSWMQTSGNFFFKYRNGLFPAIFVALFLVSPPEPLQATLFGVLPVVLGFGLVLFGQGFRLAVIGYAYIKRGGKEGKVYADDLVIRGFYAHSRNPMYVGNLSVVLGLALLYGTLWAYCVVIPLFLFIYLAITVAEETYLRGRFGAQYVAYEKSVNRFWPNFRGLSASLKEFRYDAKKAIRKDYGNVFQNLGLSVVIVGRKYYEIGQEIPWLFLGLALGVLGAFYLWARILKKSGQLAS